MSSVAGPSSKPLLDEIDSTGSLPGISLSLLSSEDYEPTSTLQYVNSQLVAHGFARSPGLSLDRLANDEYEKLVKCLLGMLSQRMEDIGRIEELGSKLRTLTYEHERLQSMYRTALETSANAEREMNFFKSKLATSQRSLASEASSHKQTLSELQRSRTSLQYLRSTTQNELKRKEKELERVLERWNKVSDAQVKLAGVHSGLHCVNLAVGVEEYPRGNGLMEEALKQAEEARGQLLKENEALRSVILSGVNSLQDVAYDMKGLFVETHVEEPTPLSHSDVFAPPISSLSHPENAHAKIREIMSAIREAVTGMPHCVSSPTVKISETEGEITKLKDLVRSLRNELDQTRQSSNTVSAQAQAVLDRFTTHASERLATGRDPTPEEAAEMSMELIGVVERDQLRGKLERREKELQTERSRFTEAAVTLGKEKAALEAERLKLVEEKRRWTVEQMLAELPPTPGPDPDLIPSPRHNKTERKPALSSPPRIRPRKVSGSRVTLKSPSKKTRIKRTTDGVASEKPGSGAAGKKLGIRREGVDYQTVDVLYDPGAESGLQRSTTPEETPPAVPSTAVVAEMKSSLPLVLPTTFSLPPPSPASSIAAADLVPMSSATSAPQVSPSAVPSFNTIPLAAAPSPPVPVAPLRRSRIFASPRTPRPLLIAHKKHAYSPARPSPLSRILMIADSPPSPPSVPPIHEEEEEENERAPSNVGLLPQTSPTKVAAVALTTRNLAKELKLVPLDEPSPLRERAGNSSIGNLRVEDKKIGALDKGNEGEKRYTAKEKGKGRAVPVVPGLTATEKENIVAVTQMPRPGKGRAPVSSSGVGNKTKITKAVGTDIRGSAVAGKASLKATAQRAATSSGPPQGGAYQSSAGATAVRPGGARRVLVNSTNPGKSTVKRVV